LLRVVAGPRRPVIPRLGPLHATVSGFMPSQAIIRRINAGLDVPKFAPLRDHTQKAHRRKAV
jgi:hypothetical protein